MNEIMLKLNKNYHNYSWFKNMSIYGVFVWYERDGPTYLVGLFPTKEMAETKAAQQYEWDTKNDNDPYGANIYFVLEVPWGTASFERKLKSHIELE